MFTNINFIFKSDNKTQLKDLILSSITALKIKLESVSFADYELLSSRKKIRIGTKSGEMRLFKDRFYKSSILK